MARSVFFSVRRLQGAIVPGLVLVAGLAVGPSAYRLSRAAGQQPPPGRSSTDPFPDLLELQGTSLIHQTDEQALAKSAGCVQCHQNTHDPHYQEGKERTVRLGCTD